MSKSFLLVLVLLASIAASTSAAAQSAAPADDPKKVFQHGVELFKQNKFEEAAAEFERAYKAKPAYKLLYNIGQAHAAAKNYDRAIEAFEQYLVEGGDDVGDNRRSAVVEEMERMRPLIGFFEIVAPAGLIVRVDGVEKGTTPLAARPMITVGKTHQIELVEGNKVVFAKPIQVRGGTVETITYRKEEPVPSAAPEVAPSKPESEPAEPAVEESNPKKVLGWIAVGAGAAILGAGGVMGGFSLKQSRALDEACPDGDCSPSRSGEMKALKRMSLTADILFGAGGAIAVTGIVLLIVSAKKKEEPPVAFVVTPSSAGIAVGF